VGRAFGSGGGGGGGADETPLVPVEEDKGMA
jgi:hypothetical protein